MHSCYALKIGLVWQGSVCLVTVSFSVPASEFSSGTKPNELSLGKIYVTCFFLHFNLPECELMCLCAGVIFIQLH